jgi:adenosylcobinamide-GDP ribazoletransferase
MTTEPELVAGERTPSAWRNALRRQPTAFLTAVRFLTRLPVPDRFIPPVEQSADLLRTSVVYFPLVGSLIGVATAAVIAGAEYLWSTWLAVLIGLAFEALLTGAFHEDAVADFCDAFGGGRSRDDVLRILKDSRVGSFGVLGLTLAILLRAGAIVEVAASVRFAAVVASVTLGRWLILVVMAWLPPVPGRESLARDMAQQVGLRDMVTGTFLAVPGVALMAMMMPARLLVALPVLIVATWLFTKYVRRRIGGATGDGLGFACYLGQVLVLLIAAASIGG